MVLDELLSDDELAALPDDEAERLAAMIRITRPRLNEVVARVTSRGPRAVEDLKYTYAKEMRECAEELGVQPIFGLPLVKNETATDDFIRELGAFASRQRITTDMRARGNLVQLSDGVKREIRSKVDDIRRQVDLSGLNERRKKALYAKLDAFERELEKPRSNASVLIGAVVLVTATLSDAGGALDTVKDSTMWIVNHVAEAHVSETRVVAELPNLVAAPALGNESDA